jgi:hypothetical protein
MSTDAIEVVFQKLYSSDPRPACELVAVHWQFPMQRYEGKGEIPTLYAVQDWLRGLTGTTGDVSRLWVEMKAKVQTFVSIEPLPYVASDGKTYERDYVNSEGLYLIAAHMRATAKRPALALIKRFLAAAGVYADDVKADPEREVMRLKSKVERKAFMAAVSHAVGELVNAGQITNDMYKGLWNRTAAQLRQEIGLKDGANLRDHQPTLGIMYQLLTEQVCTEVLGKRQSVTWDEARSIVIKLASVYAGQAAQTSRIVGYDIATGKPLLPPGK